MNPAYTPEALHGEVVAQLRRRKFEDLPSVQEVESLYVEMTDAFKSDLLMHTASRIADRWLSGEWPRLPGGAKKKNRASTEQSSASGAGPSGRQGSSSATVEQSETVVEPPEPAVVVSDETVRTVRAVAARLSVGLTPAQNRQAADFAVEIMRKAPYPQGWPLDVMVQFAADIILRGPQVRAALSPHPYVVYATMTNTALYHLVAAEPRLARPLSKASNVVAALGSLVDKWSRAPYPSMAAVLMKEGLIEQLEKDHDLRAGVMSIPLTLLHFRGNVNILREIGRMNNSPAGWPLEMSAELAEAIMDSADPVEMLWNLAADSALSSALANHLQRKASDKSFFEYLLGDMGLRDQLRSRPEQIATALTSLRALKAVKANPGVLDILRESSDLTDVLEDLPEVTARLFEVPARIRAAVDNKHVAAALSYDPHLYDSVEDDRLIRALQATRPPQPEIRTDARKLTEGELEKLGFFKLLSLTKERYPAVAAIMKEDRNVERQLVEYNTQSTQSLPIMLRTILLHPGEFAGHKLRRIFHPATLDRMTDLALPADSVAAAKALQLAARHWHALLTYVTEGRSAIREMVYARLGESPDSFATFYKYPALSFLGSRDPRPLSDIGPKKLLANPWLISSVASEPGIIDVAADKDLWRAWGDERSGLLRLAHRLGSLTYEVTSEQELALAENVAAVGHFLPRLESAFGAMSTTHWIRLLTDKQFYPLLAQRYERNSPTARALVAFPQVLREAVARPRFAERWEADPVRLDELALAALVDAGGRGTRGTQAAPEAVRELMREVERGEDQVITPEGIELDPRLLDGARKLTEWLRDRVPAKKVRSTEAGGSEVAEDVLDRYERVLGDESIRQAALGNRVLAQQLLFSPDVIDLIRTRPSLVEHFGRTPSMLGQVIRLPRLARLLTDNDDAFRIFGSPPCEQTSKWAGGSSM